MNTNLEMVGFMVALLYTVCIYVRVYTHARTYARTRACVLSLIIHSCMSLCMALPELCRSVSHNCTNLFCLYLGLPGNGIGANDSKIFELSSCGRWGDSEYAVGDIQQEALL